MEIQKAINIYLEHVKINYSMGTYNFNLDKLNYMSKWLLNENIKKVSQIKENVINKFIIEQKKRDVSNSTINKRLQSLKRCCSKVNYNINVIKLKEKKQVFNRLSENEIKLLLSSIDNINLSNKTIISILLDTGIRFNELINIKLKNIDFINNCILLDKTKTNLSRYVYFTDKTKLLINDYLKKYGLNEKIFYISYDKIKSCLNRIKNKLGINKLSPHVLRHTYASLLIDNNCNLEFIRNTLGHTDLKTTQRYLQPSIDKYKDIYKIYFNKEKYL